MTSAGSGARRVLLADPHTGDIETAFLERGGWCRVTSVARGSELLQYAARLDWELIVMDVTLPDGDGLAAIRNLKGSPATADIPILVVTARSSARDIQAGLRAGCDSYLTKPLDANRFVTEVERLIRRRSAG